MNGIGFMVAIRTHHENPFRIRGFSQRKSRKIKLSNKQCTMCCNSDALFLKFHS